MKCSETWESQPVIRCMLGTFHLEGFKIILGSFSVLAIFPKIWFKKHYFYYKSQLRFIKHLLNYISWMFPRKLYLGFLKFWILKFSDLFFFFVNKIGTHENSRTLLLQIAAKSFQTCSEFAFQWSTIKMGLGILQCWFLMIFFLISNSTLCPMGKPKTSVIWKTSYDSAKQSEIWDSAAIICWVLLTL